MCFLPLCHVAERIGGKYFASTPARSLNFVENPETVPENVREIAPTVVIAVPRVWEKFYSSVDDRGSAKRAASSSAAYALGDRRRRPRSPTAYWPASRCAPALKAQFALARWLVLDNVRKLIGIHRARFAVTGAAPISPELVRWYLALGVPMLEVWGMTESCGASTWMPTTRITPGDDRRGRARTTRSASIRRPASC